MKNTHELKFDSRSIFNSCNSC
uniref:Uncharacterized protein n=1 Tax=Arundo donax TaxID=35708 RepID=A0A0A8YR41_ARUDO